MRRKLERMEPLNGLAARCQWRARVLLAFLAVLSTALVEASQPAQGSGKPARGVTYHHDEIPDGPWSIHIVKVERGNPDFEVHSALARGNRFGLATLSEQIRALPPDIGKPVAGLNGDFFRRQEPYLGDPKGLQILRGELVSGPCDWTCLWIDPDGNPQMTNVLSRFQVTWPNGARTPFGLNEPRPRNGAVLYTSVVGLSTQTSGGRELILERNQTNTWLPLKPGVTYSARVRSIREDGNSPIPPDCMVLSLGRQLAAGIPAVTPGTVLQISTATWPELKGVLTAIGGGPAIVRGGQVIDRTDARVRHPRAAVGWNKDFIFLVEVDGRQRDLSVGMTVREFARYLVKIGVTEAMNLDGGGSATCWVYGQIMNSPSEGEERGMGNSLVIVQKEKK
jgi:large repetitive protein